MGGTPAEHTDHGRQLAAGEKITAAFELLTSAFEDARTDSDTLGKEDLLTQIVTTQHVLNTAWAVQAARLAQAAAIEEALFPDHTSPTGQRVHEVRHPIGAHQDEFIGCEIGPLLGWTSGQAVARVGEAVDVITRTPRLFSRVGTGEIEPAKVATIHRAIGRTTRGPGDNGDVVTIDLAREVETALLGDVNPADDTTEAAAIIQQSVDLIAAQSTSRLQHRTGRILAHLDPVAAGNAATRRRRDRVGVFAHPDEEPGLTHVHAILGSPTAAELMAAVDALARDLHTDTTTNKTLAECRADALTDLILGNAAVATTLVIQVPIHPGAGDLTDGETPSVTAAGVPGSAFRPAVFAHPIAGLTVHPHGRPVGAGERGGSPITSSTGVRIKSQHELDVEFNELMKTLWPPDPGDYPPGMFDHEYPPTDRVDPDGGPPAWLRAEPARPPRRGSAGSSGPSGSSGLSGQPRGSAARLGDAVVPGVGVIPAAVIEAMARSFGITMTRALIDADTGVTVETCETQYRPSRRLAEFVRARDVHCRFPNCGRPARWCDIDHVTAWPGGPTAAWNLQLLCRHHHRTKQEQHWSVTMTPDGVCTWTSPTGRTYTTHPGE